MTFPYPGLKSMADLWVNVDNKDNEVIEMGMYTELVLAFELKPHTPEKIINTLCYMMGKRKLVSNLDDDFINTKGRYKFMLQSTSQYFAYSSSLSDIYYDEASRAYCVSIRCNFKNYENEIDTFLHWIAPHIYEHRHYFLGYSMYEDAIDPTLIYLKDCLEYDEYEYTK